MISFATRSHEPERMDDLAIGGDELAGVLRAIRWVNRLLGGHRVGRRLVHPFLSDVPLHVVDLGAGLADHAVDLVAWGARRGHEIRVTAVDANEAAVALARRHVARALPPPLAGRVAVVHADAFRLPFADGSFDLATASLFLHHFDDDRAPLLLAEMRRVSRRAVLVNDLHRHPVAWAAFAAASLLVPAPAMFRDDGLLSVRRGFRRDELRELAAAAGLASPAVRWHWAFRWSMAVRPEGDP